MKTITRPSPSTNQAQRRETLLIRSTMLLLRWWWCDYRLSFVSCPVTRDCSCGGVIIGYSLSGGKWRQVWWCDFGCRFSGGRCGGVIIGCRLSGTRWGQVWWCDYWLSFVRWQVWWCDYWLSFVRWQVTAVSSRQPINVRGWWHLKPPHLALL